MTRHDIAILACKIMALWFFIQGAIVLVAIVVQFFVSLADAFAKGSFVGQDFLQIASIYAILGGGAFIVGAILWFAAPRVASRMAQKDDSPTAVTGLTFDSAMTIAFATVGAYWLVPSLKSIAGDLFTALRYSGMEAQFWKTPAWQTSMWSALIQVALSLWLIFGSRGIIRIIKWARVMAGTHGNKSSENVASPMTDIPPKV